MPPRRVVAAFATLGALALAGCRGGAPSAPAASAEGRDEAARFRNVADSSVAYTGDAVCATCHEDLWQSYQSHGMANSLYTLTADKAVEDFGAEAVFHAPSRLHYRAYREGERFMQEEYRLGAEGEKTHRLVREMKYVVGSGSAARTYLSESNGRLYQLPLTWYTQASKWDLSPGYAADNARFSRTVPDRCLACHDAYPRAAAFTNGKFDHVPEGIGCERCHGPGALHAEARLAEAEVDGPDYTIVNPRHLSLERRLDVCQQCHLQGTVMLLREGESAFGFRPGQRFDAHQALFSLDEAEGEAKIGVISQAERMQKSACFLETQGTARPLECTTCHNPHEGFRDKGPEYFNRTCQTCHAPAALTAAVPPAQRANHTPAANCFACHMPRVESEAPHSAFTDHWIRVVKTQATPPREVEAGAAVELKPYFARDREGPDAAVYRAMAYVVYGQQRGDRAALERGAAELGTALGNRDGFGEAHFLRGFALLQLGRASEAVASLETAARLGPGVPERLNALAQAYEATGRGAEAGPKYDEALRIQPALASVRVNLGRLLEGQGRLAEAAMQYRAAAAEQPWLPEAHYNLGTVLLRLQDLAGGETALREAVALEPDNALARGNLGLLYASRGEAPRARAQFEAAAESAPQSAVALGNLGAFFLNERDPARAETLLTRAVALDPGYADGYVNLALALLQLNRPADAAQRAQQALQLRPGDPRASQILAALAG